MKDIDWGEAAFAIAVILGLLLLATFVFDVGSHFVLFGIKTLEKL